MNKPSVIILGNGTQGLGIVRSAANSGLPIIQINDKYISAARFSRYLSKYIKLPANFLSKINNNKNIANELTNLLSNLPVSYPSTILGINEDIIEYIYDNKSTLEKKYFIPENRFDLIFDKYLFNQSLQSDNQIETHISSKDIFEKFKSAHYILKGRKGNNFKNLAGKKAFYLKEVSQELYNNIVDALGEQNIIIQKVVEGNSPVQSVCSFSENGIVKGLFIYEKIRQHPNRFGTGTYLRSIENYEVLKIAEQLILKINYSGISEIEFILDPEDKKFKVIEMNPRTWKSINFATQCEQNIVKKYIDFSQGKEISLDNTFVTNKYWADVFADISQMIRERKLFSYKFNDTYECTWDRKDPLPFIASMLFLPLIAFKI